jgi:methylmalonyl-CoA mutase cobalamin-binding subunit
MQSLVSELLKDVHDDGNAVAIKRYEDLEAEVHNAESI